MLADQTEGRDMAVKAKQTPAENSGGSEEVGSAWVMVSSSYSAHAVRC